VACCTLLGFGGQSQKIAFMLMIDHAIRVLLLLKNVFQKIHTPIGITPLIVIPAYEFEKPTVNPDARSRVKKRWRDGRG
jgi:hypothetical protein